MQPQFRQVPPSDRRPLDHRGAQAELRGADGGDVAAGAGADDDHVVFVAPWSSATDPFFCIEDSGTNVRRRRGGAGSAGCGLGLRRDRAARPGSAAGCSRSAAPSTTGSARRAAAACRLTSSSAASAASSATTGNNPQDHNRRTLPGGREQCQCEPGAARQLATMPRTSMSGTAKTILICDDDQGMRDTIAAILQARLPHPHGLERRGGARPAQARGRRPDPARRPPARHQRLRRPAHRQGELQPRSSAS